MSSLNRDHCSPTAPRSSSSQPAHEPNSQWFLPIKQSSEPMRVNPKPRDFVSVDPNPEQTRRLFLPKPSTPAEVEAKNRGEELARKANHDALEWDKLADPEARRINLEDAYKRMQAAVALSPSLMEYHFELGSICDKLGDYPKALEHLETAERYDSKPNPLLIHLKFTILKKMKDPRASQVVMNDESYYDWNTRDSRDYFMPGSF